MRQLRLMWPVIINPGMQTTKVDVSDGLQGRVMNLPLGVFQTRDVFRLPRRHSGAGQGRAKRRSNVLDPDPTRSCHSQAAGLTSTNQKVQRDEWPSGMSALGGG